MHHPNSVCRSALGSLLLGLLLGSTVIAQEVPKEPAPKGGPVAAPSSGIMVPIAGTQKVQMSTRRNIATVINSRPAVARVQPVANDPTSVLITGLEAGVTQLTLVDEKNMREMIEVVVQFDVEYIRTLLQRAVPTSSIQPIASGSNTIILTGTVAHQEDVDIVMRTAASVLGGLERVINALRVGGVMQVQLDVAVARVSRNKIRDMAFDFMNFGHQHIFASTVGGGFQIPAQPLTGTFPGPGITIPNSVGQPNGLPSNLFLAIFSPDQDFFGLLQALKTENVVKILAKPSLVGLSGRPAQFLDGGEQAVPVPAGLGQIGVEFVEFGTRLSFLPIILGNGKINLEVEPEVSSLSAANGTTINGTSVPGRTTQRIHTSVQLEDGQTYALGGLIQHTVTGNTVKVPIIGELPFIGAAFSRKSFVEEEDELVVLVTPHLVDAMSCDQVPKILPGQETRSPDDFELFLEGILEAPRGPREVAPNDRYVPAYKNGPTSALFPCGNNHGRHNGPGCGAGVPAGVSPTAPASMPSQVPELKAQTTATPATLAAPGTAASPDAASVTGTLPPVPSSQPPASSEAPTQNTGNQRTPATPATVPATDPAPVNLGKPTTLPPDASGTGESEEKQKSDE